jgi:flagellar hook-associated protein 1 FlgK
MALRALLAQQMAMEVTQHNVSNANTAGYHRQEAVMRAALPTEVLNYPSTGIVGQQGTGVMVDRIKRFSQDFVDVRYRAEVGDAARYKAESQFLKQVESTLGETGSDGMATVMDNFFSAWRSVGTNPTDPTVRKDLLEKAQKLVDAFQGRSTRLIQLRSDQNTGILERVDEINKTASQVARLNAEISRVQSANNQPNDLLDERDQLMDRLSELSGATYFVEDNGMMNVAIGGHSLVFGTSTYNVTTSVDTNGLVQVGWQDGQAYQGRTGELYGLIDGRDKTIVDQLSRLDTLANQFATQVNNVHFNSYNLNNTNHVNFFDPNGGGPITAQTIRLDAAVDAKQGGDYRNISAASAASQPGNGNSAVTIANLAKQTYAALNGLTFGGYNSDRVSSLALAVNNATGNATGHGNLVDVIGQQRESVAGVNLDEEAANMAKYQRSYQAAARLMTAVDEMLDKVINGMGLVGR